MAQIGSCLKSIKAIETPTNLRLLLEHRRANHQTEGVYKVLEGHLSEEKHLGWRDP